MSKCHGNGKDHCCHLGKYGTCEFLEQDVVSGRKWSCRLRRLLGSWNRVHSNSVYLEQVKPKLEDIGITVNCGDWPQETKSFKKEIRDGHCCYGSNPQCQPYYNQESK